MRMVLYFNQDESEFMPIINVEKCYETQNQYTIATENNPLPENWLSNFFQSLSEQLKFDSTGIYYAFDYATETNIQMTEQAFFINQLNRHAGKQSEYTHITILLQSLGTLYNIFTDKKQRLIIKNLLQHNSMTRLLDAHRGFMIECKPSLFNLIRPTETCRI